MTRPVFWPVASPALDARGLHTMLDEVIHCLREGALDDAVRLADKVLREADGDPDACGRAHSFRGEVFSIRGRFYETRGEYEMAIDLLCSTDKVGSLCRAHRGLAEAFANMRMYDLALEQLRLARMLVDSIAEPGIRTRATLECLLLEGLIRVERSTAAEARDLWREATKIIDGNVRTDPLLVGLNDLLGGLVLTAPAQGAEERRVGFDLLDRAADRFLVYKLPYYRARVLDAQGKRLANEDPIAAVDCVGEAAKLYAHVGATLLHERAANWADNLRTRLRLEASPSHRRTVVVSDEDIAGLEAQNRIFIAGPFTRGIVEAALSAGESDSPALVTGETGTGKEVIARLIHRNSPRAKSDFIAFNCATCPAETLESQLFGHKRGAFTGAHSDNKGMIRAAEGGTFFLDEVGDLSMPLQAKLLRFLQEKEVQPLGENKPVRVDVRVIAATHRDLERDVKEGRFRADLFHRLNFLRLHLRPLRERPDEVSVLARRLTARKGIELDLPDAKLMAGAIEPILSYDWPGNVRELEAVVERALLFGPHVSATAIEAALAKSSTSTAPAGPHQSRAGDDDPHRASPEPAHAAAPGVLDTASVLRHLDAVPVHPGAALLPPGLTLADYLDEVERRLIAKTLNAARWNRGKAAELLGFTPQRLHYRMKRLKMIDD